MWVGVGECDLFWLGVGECDLFLAGCGWAGVNVTGWVWVWVSARFITTHLLLSSTCLTLNIFKIILTFMAKNICSHCTV